MDALELTLKEIYIKRFFAISSCVICLAAATNNIHAHGSRPPDVSLPEHLDINPQVLVLAKSFQSAERGSSGLSEFSPNLKLNQTFNCTYFRAIVKSGDNESSNTYFPMNLQTFGSYLLENILADSRKYPIHYYSYSSSDAVTNTELVGGTEDRSVFEAVRIDTDGSLITELSAKEIFYSKIVLTEAGREDLAGKWTIKDLEDKNLVLPSLVDQNQHPVIGYSYCIVQ